MRVQAASLTHPQLFVMRNAELAGGAAKMLKPTDAKCPCGGTIVEAYDSDGTYQIDMCDECGR